MTAPRSILISGASSGLGRALALAYARPGARLLLIGRDAPRLGDTSRACKAAGATVEAEQIDIQNAEDLKEWILAADNAQPVDLAIACAGITSGISSSRPLESLAAAEAVLAINLLGTIYTLEPLIAPMMARKAGHLAAVGSLAGLRGLPYSPAYCASKAGLHAYLESLRPTLRRSGVSVSLIAPGFLETPLNQDIRAPRPMQVRAERAAQIIRTGLDRRKRMIAFPWPLYLGLRLLNLMPARFGDWLLARQSVDVPETKERSKTPSRALLP